MDSYRVGGITIYREYLKCDKKLYEILKENIMPTWKNAHDFSKFGYCESCGELCERDAHHEIPFLYLLKQSCDELNIDYSKGKNTKLPVYTKVEMYALYGKLSEKHIGLKPVGLCRTCHNKKHNKK